MSSDFTVAERLWNWIRQKWDWHVWGLKTRYLPGIIIVEIPEPEQTNATP